MEKQDFLITCAMFIVLLILIFSGISIMLLPKVDAKIKSGDCANNCINITVVAFDNKKQEYLSSSYKIKQAKIAIEVYDRYTNSTLYKETIKLDSQQWYIKDYDFVIPKEFSKIKVEVLSFKIGYDWKHISIIVIAMLALVAIILLSLIEIKFE